MNIFKKRNCVARKKNFSIGGKRGASRVIVALHHDGESLEVTRFENGNFTSEKISGERALQRLAIDRLAKEATIVTGLSGKEVLFRKLEIPLKEKRAILKALPFQLESSIPYPLNQAVVLPQIGKKGRVQVFATQKETLRAHLHFWKSFFVQPEFVSAYYHALWVYAKHVGKKNVTLLHMGKKESLLVVIREGELESGLFLAMGSESEKTQIKRELFRATQFLGEDLPKIVVIGESCDEVGKSEEPFALTIGLAMQESVQFIQPKKHLAKLKKRFFLCSAFLLLYLGVFSLVGRGIIHSKENALQKREQELTLRCKKELGVTPLQLGKVKVGSTLEKEGPQLSKLLHDLSLHEGIVIERVHYRLESYPTVEKPRAPYAVQVELEISAASSEVANRFYEKIRKTQKKVKWQRHENGYQITFSYA